MWSLIQPNEQGVISDIIDSIIDDEEIEDEGGIKKRRQILIKNLQNCTIVLQNTLFSGAKSG